MTSTIVHRSAVGVTMAIRDSDPAGRTIHGTAVPFDTPTRIWDWEDGEYDEVFTKGSFSKTIGERGDKVKLLAQHDRNSQLPLGRATSLTETNDGLAAEFYVSKTARGDEVLELVRDGALDSFSIGFVPIAKDVRIDNGAKTVTRTEVSLREVSVVTFPAYETATIEGARSEADARQALADALRTGRPLSVPELDALRALAGTQGLAAATDDQAEDDETPEDEGAADAPRSDPLALARRRLALLRAAV